MPLMTPFRLRERAGRGRFFRFRHAVLLFVCTGCMALAGLNICRQCGHESAENASFCSHCGTKTGAARAPDAPDAPETPATGRLDAKQQQKQFELAEKAIAEDMAKGRELGGRHREDVAVFLFLNALAIHTVATEKAPDQALERGDWLVKAVKACEGRLRYTTAACPMCQGSGRRSVSMQGMDGTSVVREVAGQSCPRCKGARTIRTMRSVEQLMVVLGQGRREYERTQLAQGRLAVGESWLPKALAESLDVRQQARVCSASALPCKSCLGFGRLECSTCHGERTQPCRHRGCKGGHVEIKPTNVLNERTALTRRVKCPQCGGTTRVMCQSCDGHGTTACKSCKGSGERDACSRCGGEGLAACRRCRGAGEYNGAECPECHGEKVVLCSTCHGDGKRTR